MSLLNQSSKAFVWVLLNQIGVQIINIISVIIITRLLLPEELGLIASIAILISIGNMLVTNGLSQSILRNPESTEKDFSILFTYSLIVGLFLYISFFILAPFIADIFSSSELTMIIRVYAFIFVLSALSLAYSTKLSHEFEFRTQAIVTISSTLISAICGIFLALYKFGVWSIVLSALINVGLSGSFYGLISKWKPRFFIKWTIVKPHWMFGYKLIIAGLLDAILTNLSSAVISKKFSIQNAGLYYRAESLKQLPLSNIGLIINKLAYPILSKIRTKESFDSAFEKIFDLVVFVTFPTLIFASISSEYLVTILFTETWKGSARYLELLCLSGLLYPVHQLNLTIINIKGYSDIFLKLQIIKTCTFLIIFSITINWGIASMIYGLMLDSILAFFINTHFLGRISGFILYKQLKKLLIPLFSVILIYLIGNYLKIEVFYGLSNFWVLLGLFLFTFMLYTVAQFIFSKSVIIDSYKIFKNINFKIK